MGSKSSQSQASTFTDNRAVLGEGSFYANNGASISSANYVLDGGAVSGAFDFGGKALTFGGDTVRSALNFGTDALAGAFDSNRYATQQAFNFGQDSLALAESAYDRALDYSTGTTNAALANLQATQKLTADAYNDAKGRGALTDKIIIGAIGAMALVAFIAVRKG